jgi:hypothetical protein
MKADESRARGNEVATLFLPATAAGLFYVKTRIMASDCWFSNGNISSSYGAAGLSPGNNTTAEAQKLPALRIARGAGSHSALCRLLML